MTLTFTLQSLMTEQCVIERSTGGYDAGGAPLARNWQPHATVPCLLWWDKSSGIRSAQREYVTAARTADMSAGGVLIPADTDVLRTDRIAQIQSFDPETEQWITYISGTIEIVGLITLADHIEIYVSRTNVGP